MEDLSKMWLQFHSGCESVFKVQQGDVRNLRKQGRPTTGPGLWPYEILASPKGHKAQYPLIKEYTFNHSRDPYHLRLRCIPQLRVIGLLGRKQGPAQPSPRRDTSQVARQISLLGPFALTGAPPNILEHSCPLMPHKPTVGASVITKVMGPA